MLTVLDDEMQRVVREQRLGFVATVSADGTPNLSPKGTLDVWDDEHLVFLDIHSPATVANLAPGPGSRSTSSIRSSARATGSRARARCIEAVVCSRTSCTGTRRNAAAM